MSNTQSREDELLKIWEQEPCEVRDLDEFPELKHDERCLNCRFWEAIQQRESALLDKVEAEVIGEDYKPSSLENDKRWCRPLPPSGMNCVSQEEAEAANWEFDQQRKALSSVRKEHGL
jgi:hypothetical protein